MKRAASVRFRRFVTPIADFALVMNGNGSIRTEWIRRGAKPGAHAVEDDALLPDMSEALARYFAGDFDVFDEIDTPAGPPFFRRCWIACRDIGPGETISYADLAQRAGNRGAARAAGQAMRRNPVAIIVPCHRVVATGGSLHGYGGETSSRTWMLSVKRWLLSHERPPIAEITEHEPKIHVNAWQHASDVAQ